MFLIFASTFYIEVEAMSGLTVGDVLSVKFPRLRR